MQSFVQVAASAIEAHMSDCRQSSADNRVQTIEVAADLLVAWGAAPMWSIEITLSLVNVSDANGRRRQLIEATT